MKKCPYCAEEIQDAAVVCRFCNRDLVAIQPPPHTVSQPSPPRAKVSGCTVLLVVAAALFLCLWVLVKLAPDNPSHTSAASAPTVITAADNQRFEEAKTKLKKAQELDLLKDMDFKSRDGYQGPFVVVGPTFFTVDYQTKRGFIETCNTFFMAGKGGGLMFNIYSWKNGKKIGVNKITGPEFY